MRERVLPFKLEFNATLRLEARAASHRRHDFDRDVRGYFARSESSATKRSRNTPSCRR